MPLPSSLCWARTPSSPEWLGAETLDRADLRVPDRRDVVAGADIESAKSPDLDLRGPIARLVAHDLSSEPGFRDVEPHGVARYLHALNTVATGAAYRDLHNSDDSLRRVGLPERRALANIDHCVRRCGDKISRRRSGSRE